MSPSSKESDILVIQEKIKEITGDRGIDGIWKTINEMQKDMRSMWFKIGLLAGGMAYLGSYLGRK